MTHPIKTLLIANRGEIALRVMRTAQRMGIRCVAVYSEADAGAPFVQAADIALPIGPAMARDSYLNVDKLLEAATQSGADAVHPGYGFLSENTDFARRLENAGIRFVGPSADSIAAMGSKSAAKALMDKAGVPLVPGYHGEDQDLDLLEREASRIGYPLLIKASAGGGGKGMRVVRDESELRDNLGAAQREAQSSFGDPKLLIERYLEKPRHVEVQILFDTHGKGIYLFDRDCSVQRRHQKVIEEAPAPGLSNELRTRMGEAAVRCGESIGYVGAGTVEFLVEGDDFYFMEMNTRLQVEHPVTELVSGLDLVEWQLRVAAGEALPWMQDELSPKGHAVEVRIYAEDPDNGFLPMTGQLEHLQEPVGLPHVRVDSGVTQGQAITAWYDPMLAKVIAWGEDRTSAIRRLAEAVMQYRARGVTLNTAFLHRVLLHPDFLGAELATNFIEKHQEQLHQPAVSSAEKLALSWLAWHLSRHSDANQHDPWSAGDGWRLGSPDFQPCEVRIGDAESVFSYRLLSADSAQVQLAEQTLAVRWQQRNNSWHVQLPGRSVSLTCLGHDRRLTVFADAENWNAAINEPEAQSAHTDHLSALNAPMHGRVTDVLCQEGDTVSAGAALVIMEAMKMEHTIRAPVDGTVTALLCSIGQTVESAEPLLDFEPEVEDDA